MFYWKGGLDPSQKPAVNLYQLQYGSFWTVWVYLTEEYKKLLHTYF